MKFYDLSREIIIKHVALLPIREKVMHTSFHSNIIHAIRKKRSLSLDDRLLWHKLHSIEKYVLGFIDRSAYHKGSCRVVLPPSDQMYCFEEANCISGNAEGSSSRCPMELELGLVICTCWRLWKGKCPWMASLVENATKSTN